MSSDIGRYQVIGDTRENMSNDSVTAKYNQVELK